MSLLATRWTRQVCVWLTTSVKEYFLRRRVRGKMERNPIVLKNVDWATWVERRKKFDSNIFECPILMRIFMILRFKGCWWRGTNLYMRSHWSTARLPPSSPGPFDKNKNKNKNIRKSSSSDKLFRIDAPQVQFESTRPHCRALLLLQLFNEIIVSKKNYYYLTKKKNFFFCFFLTINVLLQQAFSNWRSSGAIWIDSITLSRLIIIAII